MSEALAGVASRPARSFLTTLGTVLGVGAVVAVLGLTATASSQISARFNELMATEVVVEQETSEGVSRTIEFPDDAGARIESLNGAVAAGLLWQVDAKVAGEVSPVPLAGAVDVTGGDPLAVLAASPGALEAMRPSISHGVLYNDFHQARAEHVAVLGYSAAQRLGITRLDSQPAVFVGDVPLTVIGIIDDVRRQPAALLNVVIPTSTAEEIWGVPEAPPQMLVETELGAAELIGSQAPLALRPDNPDLFSAVTPPDPRSLRTSVASDLSSLFLLLAGVCLVIGAAGIANTTLVAVLERVPEIGLRKALGGRRRHIASQFLMESTILGTLGGLVGATLGIVTVIVVALARDWTAVLEPWSTLPAPLVGSVVGLLAGAYPALRAARVEPVVALRR